MAEYADVVIVGSGPNGAAYARTLADLRPEARVVLVESGPIVSTPPGHHVSNIRDMDLQLRAQMASQGPMQATRYEPATESEWQERLAGRPDTAMLRRPGLFAVGHGRVDGDGFPAGHAASNVGGMGAHWFGGCPRPALSERSPLIPAIEMDAALNVAESLLKSSATQYDDCELSEALRDRLGPVFNPGRPANRLVQPMPMAVARTAYGVQRNGVDVILGDLLTIPGKTFELRSETTCKRVLVEDGLVKGVEILDTVKNKGSVIEAKAVVVAADALHTPQLLYASGIRLKALGHYLNEHMQVGLMLEMDGMVPTDSPTGVTWIPYLGEEFPYSITITQVAPAMLPFGSPGADPDRAKIFVSLFAASDLQFDNRVDFEPGELDWRGLPKLKLSVQPSPADRTRVEEGKSIVRQIADILGRPLPGFAPFIPPLGSSLHYQGTVRMGIDDGSSVCDENCQVWGVENLFVAGNGVISDKTGTNPTLSSVALSVLSARHLAPHL
jgi:hypothetical protein